MPALEHLRVANVARRRQSHHSALPHQTRRNPRRPGHRRDPSPPADPDGGLHVEGDGRTAWGTKFVLVAARTDGNHGQIVLDVEWVPKAGGEARTAMGCFTRLANHVDGAHGIIYTALRGVFHQTMLRDLGLIPVNRVAAAKANPKAP